MRTLRFLWVVSIWICAAAVAETWTLRDGQTGEVFGPVSPSNGAEVAVGGRTLTLHVSQTKRDETVARLKRIIIPAAEFREANAADVVRFLVEASIAADPEKEGANVVFKERRLEDGVDPRKPALGERLEGRSEPVDEWGFIEDPFSPSPPVDSGGTVTLNLRRVSLYDALETIAEVAGVNWRISEGGVVIVEPAKP
ncbi:MAG: hypothetical protein EOM72_06005 [Opitutae bacterium]|nr:hypothetical protein [Opitutae bacterium]